MTIFSKPQLAKLPRSTPEEIEQRKEELLNHMPLMWQSTFKELNVFPYDTVETEIGSRLGKVVSIRYYMPKDTQRIGIRFIDDMSELYWLKDFELRVIYRPSLFILSSLYGENDETDEESTT